MAVAVGATAITISGSSAPTSTIAPSLPSGLFAQTTRGSSSRSARNRPSASAVTAKGTASMLAATISTFAPATP